MSNRQDALLSFLREHGPHGTNQLAKKFELDHAKTWRALKPLIKYDLVASENGIWRAL